RGDRARAPPAGRASAALERLVGDRPADSGGGDGAPQGAVRALRPLLPGRRPCVAGCVRGVGLRAAAGGAAPRRAAPPGGEARFGRVVAVEPDEAMLEVLAEVVPGAEGRIGSGERIPLGDAEVDCVFVAEAFHWFASPGVVAEIARVLRPGGGLVLLWNVEEQ